MVFSQSLLSLDIIESYLEHVDNEYNEELNKKYDDSKKEKTDGKVKDENSESKDKSVCTSICYFYLLKEYRLENRPDLFLFGQINKD